METLDQIAIRTGTDKNSNCHNYCNYYEQFFAPLRDQPIKLLELGVYHGDSLRMWADYFQNGLIYGADIEVMSQHDDSRIKTYLVDELDILSLVHLKEQVPLMDIIVNDASHLSRGMILSFEHLFPHLKPGGYFVLEDLLCDYFEQWRQHDQSVLGYVKKLLDDVQMGGKIDQNWLCSNKKQERLKYDLTYWEHEIEWVFNSCGLVIIKKL